MIRKVTFAVLILMAGTVLSAAQNVTAVSGKVMNAMLGEPMEFASVALVQSDSVIVTGAMADADGQFLMTAAPGSYLLKASFLGYKDAVLPVTLSGGSVDAGILKMEEDANVLNEVEIKSTLPKTQVKGDAVVTSIEGSVLEHSGNAFDVLGKVPGMISMNGTLEVLGRGVPEYYINGRKVTDTSELRNLMSEEIKSVDVISNPGAEYGGEVRCVVRIRTVKRQGEGFSFALTSQAKKYITCSDLDPSWSVLDLNYRKGGLDLFGKFVYWSNHSYQVSDMYAETNTVTDGGHLSHVQDGIIDAVTQQAGIQGVIGANWQINDNHSLGFKIDGSNTYKVDSRTLIENDYIVNGAVEDHVLSINGMKMPVCNQWTGNLYYDGNVGKLNINFNSDFLITGTETVTDITETSLAENPVVSMTSNADAKVGMGAAKLVLSYPIWKGSLQFGSEETFLTGTQTYSIDKPEIPAADSRNRENTIAGFAQYALALPFGQLSAGIRYEHVDFHYEDRKDPENDLTRRLDDWFPSVSFATRLGEVGMALSYTGKTLRPHLQALSSEIQYNNRYIYQSGDPKLLSKTERTLALNANWRWLTFSSTYERIDNDIQQWATPFGDGSVVMLRYSNLKDANRVLSMYLTASPTVGVWSPVITAGFSKQFLKMHVTDPRESTGERVVCLDKPMYLIQANNAFRLKHGWLLELNYQYISSMSQSIITITKPLQSLDMSVQKSFLKNDALTFRLSWNDILNRTVQYVDCDFGCYFFRQSNDMRNPGVVLRVSYRFNSADSKYKGTGAGQSVKDRM